MNNNLQIPKELKYLFNKGELFYAYKILGAHVIKDENGKTGTRFSVWAPEAKSVSVVCNKNGWDRNINPMEKDTDSGIWTAFLEGVKKGEVYKYSIESKDGRTFLKADPFAFQSEVRPATASVVFEDSYKWKDKKWMDKRRENPPYDKPINIYEMHFGSWKRHEDGTLYSYEEMAESLVPYVKEQGYTHIELMPLAEYPFDGSWGYQVTGYYSVNSRYGSPDGFKKFVDKCHRNGIGVIMDWVPAHFPKDAHGLARFDGSCLFEHPDSRRGEHKEWGTLVFNWEKSEVHSFLISNTLFWLEEYHIDGLRVDAVSSMLYLDYNRRDGEWIPNKYGGNENLDAIEFLQKMNKAVFERFPNVLMIAEESTAWGGVTMPAHEGGLGFNFKWNMGWMNDILRYMSMDPFFRGPNHGMITFSLMYAFSENYILPLSHDEVVHGKRSLVDKMYGNYEQKFASLRLLYAYMYAHPGKKLLFMGGEIAQFIEWRFAEQLDWLLLDYEMHRNMQKYTGELNRFYKSHKAMHEVERDWAGFKWICPDDNQNNVVSFMRISKNKRDKVIVVANFAARRRDDYYIGVPTAGEYEVVFSTNDKCYGGTGDLKKTFKAEKEAYGDFKYRIKVDLPALSAFYIKKKGNRTDNKKG